MFHFIGIFCGFVPWISYLLQTSWPCKNNFQEADGREGPSYISNFGGAVPLQITFPTLYGSSICDCVSLLWDNVRLHLHLWCILWILRSQKSPALWYTCMHQTAGDKFWEVHRTFRERLLHIGAQFWCTWAIVGMHIIPDPQACWLVTASVNAFQRISESMDCS